MTRLDTVERAVADIAAGKAVVVVDDEDRENEGDLIFAAEKATPELVAFMVRYTSGYICVATRRRDCDRLGPAADVRASTRTARHRLHRDRRREDRDRHRHLGRRPGHDHRAAGRPGDASPATSPGPATWCRCGPRRAACCAGPGTPRPPSTWPGWPGCGPAGAICEIVSQKDEGAMAAADELRVFADEHGLALISHRRPDRLAPQHEKHVERVAEARIPTRHGEFRAVGYASIYDGRRARRAGPRRRSPARTATARTCWCACTPSA